MFKISYAPSEMKNKPERMHGDLIPRLNDVRRVPMRFYRILPLAVIKRYQCAVLGRSANSLTVGITEREDEALINLLQALTGATIFPVLVEPARMRLLIMRMERCQCFNKRYSQAYYTQLLPAYVRLLLALKKQ